MKLRVFWPLGVEEMLESDKMWGSFTFGFLWVWKRFVGLFLGGDEMLDSDKM